jgi:hypothetical protein
MSGVLFPSLQFRQFYDYEIRQFTIQAGLLQPCGTNSVTIKAAELELETMAYWLIYLPANYHDVFYSSTCDPNLAIPTQITGGVGEAMALVIMRKLFGATGIDRINPSPSSQSADFEMDIIQNGKKVHALVESKGSNRVYRRYPPLRTVHYGAWQLIKTRLAKTSAISGYLIITSYPAKTCFVIKVF